MMVGIYAVYDLMNMNLPIFSISGAQNDSRMNVGLVMTAAALGAATANHVEAVEIIKDEESKKVCGAIVRDVITGETWPIRCKVIRNDIMNSIIAVFNA